MLSLELSALVIYGMGFVISVSIHEYSHAFALYLFGDQSIRTRKRLSLRPDLHFKWWGYLLLLLTGVIVGNPVLAEQDEVDPKYNWYVVLIITKLAGPLSNLMAVILTLLVLRYLSGSPDIYSGGYEVVGELLDVFVVINLFLFAFNMIPVPLLDGGVFLLVIGMMLDMEWVVIIVSLVGVVVLLVLFNWFPESPFVEFVNNIIFRAKDVITLWIVGEEAF